MKYLADPGKARGYSTITVVISSLIKSVTLCPSQTMLDRLGFLNLKGCKNPIIGSKVTAICVDVW